MIRRLKPLALVSLGASVLIYSLRADDTDQLPPTLINGDGADDLSLQWQGIAGRTYFIECSTDFQTWTYCPHISAGADAVLDYDFTAAAEDTFLRLRYTDTTAADPFTADFDADGISNWNEIRTSGTGTDPFEPDTSGNGTSDYDEDSDADNLPDGWEVENFDNTSTSDGSTDSDGDGLNDELENQYGTSPTSDDTDDDGILDGEDGWPLCEHLAPARLATPSYVVVPLTEREGYMSGGEINNNNQAIFGDYKYDVVNKEYFFDGSELVELPATYEVSGYERRHSYSRLNDTGYFLQINSDIENASYHEGIESYSITAPVNLLLDPSEGLKSDEFDYISSSHEDFFHVENNILSNGDVIAYGARLEGFELSVDGALHSYIEGNVLWKLDEEGGYKAPVTIADPVIGQMLYTGEYATNNGEIGEMLTYTENQPITVMSISTFPLGDVNSGSVYRTSSKINTHDLVLSKQIHYSEDYIRHYKIGDDYETGEVFQGEQTEKIGVWSPSDDKFFFLTDAEVVPFFYERNSFDLTKVSLNNQNTVTLFTEADPEDAASEDRTEIWLDTKAGIQNDQEVDNNPTYEKITWDTAWGSTPPTNLNTQMRGYGYSNSTTRIWQNGEWLDLDDLISGDDWTVTKIHDMNDHGTCIASATDAEGNTHAVMLVPVEVAPEVLAVNSDFDEGRIDVTTGYAIPDCDDVTGVDRETGAGNGLLALNAKRVHLDGLFANDEKVTDDLHQGWFGISPNQCDDAFWDGAEVTIRKIDQKDADTGYTESGQIRFYAKWGESYYGIEPYEIIIAEDGTVTYEVNELVTSGVNKKSGEGVYGSTSTIPDDAEFWMEGVRPGKITLEWRYQKGDVDIKYEQTFLVATQKSLADWKDEVRYQIRLQSLLSTGQEVDVNNYNPDDGVIAFSSDIQDPQNTPYIQEIYLYYRQLYAQNEDELLWAGMARVAASPIYAGMYDLQWWATLGSPLVSPLLGTKDSYLQEIFIEGLLLEGQKAIFADKAWAHKAYIGSGIWALRYVQENGGSEATLYAAWENINAGIETDDFELIKVGGSQLLEREQRDVVQENYEIISNIYIKPIGTIAGVTFGGVNPTPIDNGLVSASEWLSLNSTKNPIPGGPGFRSVVPDGKLDNFNDRWTWTATDADSMLNIWVGDSASSMPYDRERRASENSKSLLDSSSNYSFSLNATLPNNR